MPFYHKVSMRNLCFIVFCCFLLGLKLQAQGNNSNVENPPVQGIKGKIKVFPNPAVNVINILGLTNTDKAIIAIIDVYGNVLLKHNWAIKNNAANIPISSLTKGMYIVDIQSKKEHVRTKFYKK